MWIYFIYIKQCSIYPYILMVITRNKIAWVFKFCDLSKKHMQFIQYWLLPPAPASKRKRNEQLSVIITILCPVILLLPTEWVLLSCFCNCKEITMPLILRQHGNENFIFITKFMGMKTFFCNKLVYIIYLCVGNLFHFGCTTSLLPYHQPHFGGFWNMYW